MEKPRAHQAAAFLTACLIWCAFCFITLHKAAYNMHHATTAVAAGPRRLSSNPWLLIQELQQQPELLQKLQSHHPELGPATYDGSAIVILSYTSSAYIDWSKNWALHCSRLKVDHAIIAFDQQAAAALAMAGLPSVLDASAEVSQLGLDTHSSFRNDFMKFRLMGHIKVSLALRLMLRHHWQSMVISDPDVVWLRHPRGLLQLYPDADLMVSTDCLSAQAVAEGRADVYRCGMQPGGWNSAWNTGVVVVRNNERTVKLLQAWSDALSPAAQRFSEEGWWIDDQLGFTRLLDSGSLPFQGVDDIGSSRRGTTGPPGTPRSSPEHVRHEMGLSATSTANGAKGGSTTAAKDGHSTKLSSGGGLVWAWRKQLKVAPLPPLVVTNGHVAFEQRLPQAYNTTPYAVHFTFQAKYNNAGKLSRIKEAQMWLLDSPATPGVRFCTYHNTVQQWIRAVEQLWMQHTGKAQMAMLHKHLLAAAFQLQVLSEALAAAHALGRTLAPPGMVCYCTEDTSAFTDALNTCAVAGSDKGPPFQCTFEMLVNVVELQQKYSHLLKIPNYLQAPELQPLLQHSSIGVQVLAKSRPADVAGSLEDTLRALAGLGQPAPEDASLKAPGMFAGVEPAAAAAAATAASTGAVLIPGHVTGQQLQQQLTPYAAAAVVDFGRVAPGWFAGLEQPEDVAQVQQMIDDLTASVGWCCLLASETNQDMQHAYVPYQHPTVPTAAGAGAGASPVDCGSAALLMESTGGCNQVQVGGIGQQQSSTLASWMPADELFMRPKWCIGSYLQPFNLNVSLRENHPCHYLEGVEYTAQFKQSLVDISEQMHDLRARP